MSQAGNALLRGVDAEAVVADLDRLRAAHVRRTGAAIVEPERGAANR